MCIGDRNAGASGIAKGDIYYRYPGQTTRIGYTELDAIIRGREEAIQRRWQAMIDRMRDIGIENAAVLDTVSGRVEGAHGSFFIDENLLSKVSFVREGQFSETSGQPALRIVGDVKPIDRGLIQPVKEIKSDLFEDDLLEDFLRSDVSGKRASIRSNVGAHTRAMAANLLLHRPIRLDYGGGN
jgi:hypothetical protein